MSPSNNSRRNAEKPVACPVEGCNAESVAREMHLHLLWSAGNGHGELGEIPDEVRLEAFMDRLSDERESEEPVVFAEFSKEQVDYLSKVIYSQTDDKKVRLILERPYVESL